MRDAGPIVVFAFWSFVILSCGAFLLWKWSRSSRFPIKPILIQGKSSSGVFEDDKVSR
jgi:hypothetical protein